MIAAQLEIQLLADIARIRADMDRAGRIVDDATSRMGRAAGIAKGALGAIAGALSVAAFASWIKGAIDAADAASKLSSKTGVAVKDLAGLQLAYDLGGAGGDAFASSMVKLSRAIVDGNDGLRAMGIQTKDSNGQLLSNKTVLYSVADAFAKMDDGARKTAMAVEIFGKTGADLIPLLNGGAEGFRQMDEMARKLGLTMDEQTAKSAEAFNDNLDLLAMGSQGIARGISAELLPTLSSLSGSFLESMTSGDKLKGTADFLSTALKLLYVVAVGIVEIFSTVGKTIGAAGAQVAAIMSGEFKLAAEIGKNWQQDVGDSWAATAKTMSDAWSGAGSKTFEEMSKLKRAEKDSMADQAARDAAKKKAEKSYEAASKGANDYIASLRQEGAQIGLAADQIKMLAAAREAAKAPEAAQRKLIMETALANDIKTKSFAAVADAEKRAADAQKDIDASVAAINSETEALQLKIKTYGMLPEAITRVQIAELKASKQAKGLSEKDRADIQLKIDALGKLAEAQTGTTQQAEGQKVIDDNLKAQVSMWESIDKTAHDTFVSIFDSGKSAFNRLRDTLKNGLMDLLYQMTIKKWIFNIVASVTGSAVGGAAQAAGSAAGGGSGSALGTVASAGSLLAGGASIFGAGGLAGSLAAGAGWVTGATTLGGSLAAAGSLAATGTLGGIASGLGMAVGALGPIALGLMAVVAVWKKLDTSGTSHTGGAASASSAGVSTIRAESIGFQYTKTTAEAEKFVAGLASGVVNILDSTALAFGKTAGYTAATAFADDTSKDGAWGALLIQKMGSTVLDWNSTRSSKWAPKEFGDGEAGQKQYLAALSASVRTALDSIGLPAWAKKMLDGVGAGASIEDLAKVVDQINATQRALSAMKDQLPGFKNMTEAAVSALMAASGGIEALATSAGTYFDAFMTESEKSASTIKQITEALATVGIVAPTSRDAFRALVEEQMKLGEAGASTVAMLFKVSGAFAQVYPQMEATASAAKSVADVLSERNDLQRELDELTMTSVQLIEKQRKALDPSNRALFDQIEALKAMRTAQDAAKTSMGDVISRMKSFGDSARTLRDSLLMGALSVLTPEQQYAEARRQRDATRAAALGGDTAAQGNLSAMQTAFLTISQKVNGGDAQYSADFASVLQMSDEIAKWSAGQVDVAQSSLDALNAQVLGIADLNATAHLIADQLAGTPNYSAMGTENMAPLVAEIKSLREEVKGLRADQAAQTGDLIASNGAVTMDAAREVSSGVAAAATDSGWESRNAGWVNLR